MEQMKNALNALEKAVLRLEEAIHAAKKERAVAQEQVQELKSALKITYDRLDNALTAYKKGTE